VVETELLIRNQFGLHVRAPRSSCASHPSSSARCWCRWTGIEVNGKSILGVMMLAAEMGSTI
jgi:phosphocarrier protein